MSGVELNPILGRVFRSNPAYELAPFDHLPHDQRALLNDLTDDPDFYGVLLPRAPGTRGIKSVCRDTALLLHTMIQPGPLPTYVLRSLGERANQAVAELVLDGVLEIERDGGFVSGSEAYFLIYPGQLAPNPQRLLARLSLDALKYAQALSINDRACLSARLYFYNRIPLTAYWSRRLPSQDAVSEFLGISSSNSLKLIHEKWTPVESATSNNTWFQWQSNRRRPSKQVARHGYKLYVSPQPNDLPDAFRSVVEILDDSGAYSFKIGRSAIGLLRPDKLVLYFYDFDSLQETARDIALVLSGCAVHGVPFTAKHDR